MFWVWLFAALPPIVCYRLKTRSFGRAFLSIREDEVAAQAMGADITRYNVRAFVLPSFFAGVAGGLYAMDLGAIPAGDLGFQKSIDIIIMVVLGGMGSISGAALAAGILTVLPEALRDLGPDLQQFRLVIYALLLITMMIVRPQGLFGVREVWELGRSRKSARAREKAERRATPGTSGREGSRSPSPRHPDLPASRGGCTG